MLHPQIVEKPALTVVGCETPFLHALSPTATNIEVIGPLWGRFLSRAGEVAGRKGDEMYGVIYSRSEAERSHPDELQYIAGVAVENAGSLPAGMVSRTVDAGAFAVFLHRGPIQGIRDTVSQIYRDWLPRSGYLHTGVADVELYDHRFCLDSADSIMEYWVSVTKRSPVNSEDSFSYNSQHAPS
ncbi:MAG TPA: GyrI-like domain-containing protein [Pirellulales bacterium]|nr:GyrI-like domain-containing protein [Pirellulales bacterium]